VLLYACVCARVRQGWWSGQLSSVPCRRHCRLETHISQLARITYDVLPHFLVFFFCRLLRFLYLIMWVCVWSVVVVGGVSEGGGGGRSNVSRYVPNPYVPAVGFERFLRSNKVHTRAPSQQQQRLFVHYLPRNTCV
jgi:hypothetical protein